MAYYAAMTERKHYDLVFSLGQLCACSQVLRVARLQFASFPLDWVSGGTVESRATLIASHFDGWLEKEDFVYEASNPKQNGLGIYENRRTGLRHPHDFSDVTIDRTYDTVREKYRRRTERLLRLIAQSRRVLCVYIVPPEQPAVAAESLTAARRILSAANPGVAFDIICFSCENGVAFSRRRIETPAEGITTITFDYRNAISNVDIDHAAQALAELGVTATDPRSEEERKAYARHKAQEEAKSRRAFKLLRKMEKYGVTTRGALWRAQLKAFFRRLLGIRDDDTPAGQDRYDLAFSLGEACACSQALRRSHLQLASFPLDWISGGTFIERVKLVADRFAGWLEKADFVYEGTNPVNGLGIFRNRHTGFTHLHDFPDKPLDEGYPEVLAKYARRTERLYRLIGESRRILCVYLSRPAGPELPLQELTEAQRILAESFPGTAVTLLHFRHEPNRAFRNRLVQTPAEGILQVVFDYSAPERDMDLDLVVNALRELGLGVRDYRTAAERREFRRRQKLKKHARQLTPAQNGRGS